MTIGSAASESPGGVRVAPPVVCSRDSIAETVLAVVVCAPCWVVAWGRWGGEVLFTSYREPKLAALLLGVAVLTAVVAWRRPFRGVDLVASLCRPAPALILALVVWSGLSVLWAPVPEHVVAELVEWVPAVTVLLVGVAWTRREGSLRWTLSTALITAAAGCTLVGWIQMAGPIEVLIPIRPEAGVQAPSLMGYRNPMAHLICGQLMLTFGLWGELLIRRRWRWLTALSALIVIEVGYLAQLQSRTALVAVTVGLLTFAVGAALVGRRQRWGRTVASGALAAIVLVLVVAVIKPASRERVVSVLGYLAKPSSLLSTDRGIYAANTLSMVRDRPLGSGAGNWFVLYPVYRSHGRNVGFLEGVQVRRAHSDHVQMLGELGWVGGALWLGFIVSILKGCWSRIAATGAPLAVAVGAQWMALLATMATDYSIELPVLRMQMAVMVVLAVGGPVQERREPTPVGRRWPVGVVAGCFVVAVMILAAHVVVRDLAFHRAHALYDGMMQELRATGDPELQRKIFARYAPEIRQAAAAWATQCAPATQSVMLPALMTDVELIGGHLGKALEWGDRTLALHPYFPNIVRTLAIANRHRSPDRARLYEVIWRYLRDSASSGYELPVEPREVAGLTLGEVREMLRQLDVNRSGSSASVSQGP